MLGRERALAVVKYLHPTIFLRRLVSFVFVSFLIKLLTFWLYRTKESVQLQLPQKTDMIVLCPLTPLQKEVYRRMIASPDVELMLTIKEPCECGATDENGLNLSKGECCHQGWSRVSFLIFYILLCIPFAKLVVLNLLSIIR